MKFFKKIFKYFGVLVLLVGCVAGFKVANFMLNKPEEEEFVEPSGVEEESALTKIIDKVMAMNSADFDMTFDIVSGHQEIGVDANIIIDMGTATKTNPIEQMASEGMKISLDGSVCVNGENLNFDISYVGDYVYADISGVRVKLQTANAIEDITGIMALGLFDKLGASITLPEISLDSFDTSLLIKLTESLKEEKSAEGNKISLNLFGYGEVVMFTDKDYNLQKIELGSLNFDGLNVSGKIDSQINCEVPTITEPHDKEEIVDVSDITSLITSVDTLLNKGYVSGVASLNLFGSIFEAKYQVDFKDFNNIKAYFETEIASQKLIAVYQNEKVYVAYDGYKYYVELENFDINEIITKVEELIEKFGYEKEDISEIDVPEINAEEIKSSINNFVLNSDEITIGFDKAILQILLKNEEFSVVNFTYDEYVEFSLSLDEEIDKENLNLDEFVAIEKLERKINVVLNQLKEKKLATKLNVSVDGSTFETTLFIDLNNGFKARMIGDIAGYSYDIIYKNNFVYLNVNDFKIKYEIPNLNLETLLSDVENLMQQYIPNFEIPQVDMSEIESVVSDVDFMTVLALVSQIDFKVLDAKQDILKIKVDGFILSIDLNNDKLANINMLFENYALNVDILSNDFEIDVESKYIRINEALEYIPAIIEFANAKKYEFTTTIGLGEIIANVTGRVDISGNLTAQIVVDINGEKLVLTYIDEVVYVDYRTISIKGSLAEIQKLLEDVIPQVEAQESISIDLKNLNILQDMIKSGNVLQIILTNGLNVTLEKENGKLTGLGLAYGDYELALELATFDEEIVYTENKNVLNAVELYDFANAIANFVMNEDLAFELEFTYKDLTVNGKVMYAENNVTAYIETTVANRVLMLIFKDNQIYANFDGFGITCKIDEINDLIEYVTTYAGVELPTIDTETTFKFDFSDILNSIVLTLENEVLSIGIDEFAFNIVTNGKLVGINAEYGNLFVKLTPCENFKLTLEGNYIDLYEVKELSKAVYNSMKNLSISGTIEVTLELFGEDNMLSIDYAIGYRDNKIMGYIETEFKGLSVNAYIDGEDIYLNVVGLQMHFNIRDMQDLVDWINETFEANLSLDFINDTIENLKDIKLDMIISVVSNEGVTYVTLKNGTKINVVYGEYLETITFIDGTREAIITCTDFSLVNLDNLNRVEYRDYTEFTPVIASVYKYALSMNYDLNAEAKVYYNDILTSDIEAILQLDVTDGLNAYAYLKGLGEDIVVNYQEKKIYFSYAGVDGLKISVGEEAIQEIAAILLSAMGVDTSTIPFLDEVLKNENLDTDNLGSVLPKVEFGNPLSYLEYISNFEVTDEYFAVNIKGEKISEHAIGKDVSIRIYYKGGQLTHIAVTNLYTSANEYVNIDIKVNNFTGITQLDTVAKEKYIDLTNSKDLVKALVHTSQLNDYHIKGKINLTIDFLAEMTAATLNVDARIQRKEVEKTYIDEDTGRFVTETINEITGVIVLDNYPLISALNGDNTNGGVGLLAFLTGSRRYRSITIVLKDGYAYVMTEDAAYKDYAQLTRATKVTTEFLLGNISYYIKYLLGFIDSIQTKIDDMIHQSMTYSGPINYGKIIDSYKMNGRTHTIGLNMAEIAHNDQIGLLTLDITTKNDAETNYKDYLYKLDISVVMLDGMIKISTDSTKDTSLYLVDIGKTVDMSVGEKFINDYDVTYGLGFDGEWVKEGVKGTWRQANSGTVTITYKANGEEFTSSGNIASSLTLPKPENYVVVNGKTHTEYKFAGWFTDAEYSKQFTANAYPRYNTTLYAKYEIASVKSEVTITFVTNEETLSQAPLTKFAGSTDFTMPTLNNVKYEPDENTVVLKTFLGWYTAGGEHFTSKTFPTEDITLYARWKEEITETYHLEIYFNDESIFNSDVPAGKFESNILTQYDAFFDKNGNAVTDFTITEDTTWIAKNEYDLVVSSQYSKDGVYSVDKVLYNGEEFSLPSFASYEVDMTTYIIEYTFLGYYFNGDKSTYVQGTTLVMPTSNATFVAQWKVEEYCYVTFHTDFKVPSSWVNTLVSKITKEKDPDLINGGNAIKLRKGTIINDLEGEYNSTAVYYYKAMGFNGRYDFFVAAWVTSGIACDFDLSPDNKGYDDKIVGQYTVTSHIDFYAYWDAYYTKA